LHYQLAVPREAGRAALPSLRSERVVVPEIGAAATVVREGRSRMSISAIGTEGTSHNTATVIPADDFNYYQALIYWNNFEKTISLWNEAISGDSNVSWIQHLKLKYGNFNTALFLNCGNGWVERALFEAGVINSAIGVDAGRSALDIAASEAEKIGMPYEYIRMDTNDFSADGMSVDLVVNYAAMHHVACVNRVTRELRDCLVPDGLYVLMDYVGPHRNQYPWCMWSRIVELNEMLPPKFKNYLRYPHMKTMLATDPTEAIHSELQVDIMKRYFNIEEYVSLGGGIAYTILFENKVLFRERDTSEGKATLDRIFEEDHRLLTEIPESNLFAFSVSKPKARGADTLALVKAWQKEEDDREERARQNDGRYYPANALEVIYNEISEMTV
jgi:SAM-dependent methyltransferase